MLSFNHRRNKFYSPKTDKKAIKLFELHLALFVTFHHFFFHLLFPKLLYKSVVLSIIKQPYKTVLLSIITCRHLFVIFGARASGLGPNIFFPRFYFDFSLSLVRPLRKLICLVWETIEKLFS